MMGSLTDWVMEYVMLLLIALLIAGAAACLFALAYLFWGGHGDICVIEYVKNGAR